MTVEHPRWASGRVPDEPDSLEFQEYERFVKYMLNACEGILLFVGNNPLWVNSIKSQIGWHKNYCKTNQWFRKTYREHYDPELCLLIDEVCESK